VLWGFLLAITPTLRCWSFNPLYALEYSKEQLTLAFYLYNNIELNIPNTTNAIGGHFADLKNKLRNHNGLSLERKMKPIDRLIKA